MPKRSKDRVGTSVRTNFVEFLLDFVYRSETTKIQKITISRSEQNLKL
jgi:hypothetical protein